MLLDGRTFDFGYVYDGWKGYAFLLQNLISAKKSDFASHSLRERNLPKNIMLLLLTCMQSSTDKLSFGAAVFTAAFFILRIYTLYKYKLYVLL